MRRFLTGFFKVFGTLLLIGILTGTMLAGLFFHYIKTDIWESEEVRIDLSRMPVNLSSKLYYFDKDTGAYKEWVTLVNNENRIWTGMEDIPVDFQHAFVAIEDQRFYTHHGVDWKRTIAAALNMFTGNRIFGGSTITQQLIKNLTEDNEVTIRRKVVEICRALKLEQRYSKAEILEWYMNIIYFGRGQYGIASAAKYYFGKEVADLSLSEMCSIAGITNNPSRYDPYAFPQNNKDRRDLILGKMLELGYIDEEQWSQAKAEELTFLPRANASAVKSEVYPYYVDAVIEDVLDYFQSAYGVSEAQASSMLYYGGYHIYTCVDMEIQKKMDSVYQDLDKIPKSRDGKQLQSSMVVMDPYTGDIVGIEGGVGEKTVARGLNWACSSLGRRPPGSSIKPIAVYGPALDGGLITPDTVFLDAPDIQLKGTDWFPKNDDWKNRGPVTIRTGITSSLNTIAAQVMDELTPKRSYAFLTETLHMRLEESDQDYAPLATGQLTVGTTAREMASAYTLFPNQGVYTQGRTFSKIFSNDWTPLYDNQPISNYAISEKAAYWMTDMLEDAVAYGTGSGARLSGMHCAGKTGTTSDSKDRWFVGYTPYYVGAVWCGYETPKKVSVSGNPSAKLWKSVMELIHEDLEDIPFPVPEDTYLGSIPGYPTDTADNSGSSPQDGPQDGSTGLPVQDIPPTDYEPPSDGYEGIPETPPEWWFQTPQSPGDNVWDYPLWMPGLPFEF